MVFQHRAYPPPFPLLFFLLFSVQRKGKMGMISKTFSLDVFAIAPDDYVLRSFGQISSSSSSSSGTFDPALYI
jgi:hypothetical protein